jgi:hypothetical protein
MIALMPVTDRPVARDIDGRYAGSPLKAWFDGLRSGKGPCCADADGSALSDADWKTQHKVIGQTPGIGGPQAIFSDYAVNIDGQWIDVPPEAVITEPNKVGHTMVWPIKGYLGITIRCFMPGSVI